MIRRDTSSWARPALALALPMVLAAHAACAATPAAALGETTHRETAAYSQHLHVLASEYMEGRLPGTPGIDRAADYIIWNFRDLGLEPAFPAEETAAGGEHVVTHGVSHRQSFPIGDEAELDHQNMAVRLGGERIELEPGEDFNATAWGGSGEVDLPITFVGYSIVAGPNDYLGYDHATDLTGRAAMILRFEPMTDQGTSRWSDKEWSYAATLGPKFLAAARRGAEAIILVSPPGARDERAEALESVRSSGQGQPVEIPVVHVTPEIADRIVRAGDPEGRTLEDLIAMANEGAAIVDLEGPTARIDVGIEREPVLTDNLGAVLPGKGELADEYVVIGAHYDHLGRASFGTRFEGEMHLGADDNASGTAGLLTAAETLAAAWDEIEGPARSVLFLAFSAEESGLNGSQYYVEHPIAPLDQHYLMINMDMIGSLRRHVEAGGVGSGQGLQEMVAPLFEQSGVDVETSLSVGSGRSDHASFDRNEVPNLFFFTGITDYYHTPDDTADTINAEGAAKIASLAADVALTAATRTDPLPYVERQGGDQDRRRIGGVKVRVGIAPGDYTGDAGGVLIARVFEGTSADEAGLQEGDRITVWNGEPLETVMDWMPLLASHEPGDTIDIVIVRDGEEMTLPITLKARQARGE